jgi:DNA replication and repair protein RecF
MLVFATFSCLFESSSFEVVVGLHELTLRNFRLFREYSFEPDPEAVTVFLSPNGTGKTSVLEAVHALATASSFRTSAASDMVRNNETTAEVHGVIFQRERRVQVDLTLTRGVRNTTKKMLVNGQRPGSRAEISEVLPLTVFTPEGVEVVRGGPEHRRTFLTTLLTDVDPLTGEVIERFSRVLSQRNALLRSLEGSRPSPTQQRELDQWTRDFCAASDQLLFQRQALLDQLAPLAASSYHELAQNAVEVGVRYERSWQGELLRAMERASDDDRYRGYTTVGPHRDDIELLLEGRDARRQASQGEQRSLALALRLAGHELVRQRRGVDPLLLLDDVFSELDPVRSDRLLGLLPAGQTLVTTASPLPSSLAPAAVIDLTGVLS